MCTHLQCFDLDTYIDMNSRYKRWQCPFCSKRSSFVRIDPFFKAILDQMAPLRETIDDIDDKITLFKDLKIRFTRDKGKWLGDYNPMTKQDESGQTYLVGYEKASGDAPMDADQNESQGTGTTSMLGKRPQCDQGDAAHNAETTEEALKAANATESAAIELD